MGEVLLYGFQSTIIHRLRSKNGSSKMDVISDTNGGNEKTLGSTDISPSKVNSGRNRHGKKVVVVVTTTNKPTDKESGDGITEITFYWYDCLS